MTESFMLSGLRLKIKDRRKTMKKTLKLLMAALLLFALTATLFGCGKSELSLDDSAMPQTVYVLGEELDLSSGKLVVTSKKKTETVPMNDEDVTVTGYDKEKLGEQTLTVTYGKASVDFKITVVERMQVIDYASDYLVGDTIDLSKGKLKITRNDGSNYTVILKNDKVTVTELDSSTPGERTLTATYKSGNDTYTANFKVRVHEIEDVSFSKPTKVTYKSHEDKIDLTGALITLTGKGGELKRDVAVTENMVEGFDLSAADGTNTPFTQTVTVEFGTRTFTFDIKITYTDVSFFNNNASLFADFDWLGEDIVVVPADKGEIAMKMMEMYFDMSPAEKSLISKKATMDTARAAMVYGLDTWAEDFLLFEDAFTLYQGEFTLTCESEDALRAAISGLANKNRPIYTFADVLDKLIETYAEEQFTKDDYFGDYFMIDPLLYPELVKMFEYMLELDVKMDEIPENWQNLGVDLNDYADELQAVLDFMASSDYMSYDYSNIFYYVSMWREKDDVFEALYHYYFEKEDVASLAKIAIVRLPAKLEELYSYMYAAMQEMQIIASYGAADTTYLLYNCYKAEWLINSILEGSDDMEKVLLISMPINGIMGMDSSIPYYFEDLLSYISTAEGGYYALAGALIGNEKYDNILKKYLEVIDKRLNDDENDTYKNSDEYAAAIEELFNLYLAFSPAEQFSFLGTLNVFYAMSIPPYCFDASGEYADYICLFVDMLDEYFKSKFTTEAAGESYVDLMIALEAYAQRYTNSDWLNMFKDKLASVMTAYNGMNDTDKETFNKYFKTTYDKYAAMLADIEATEKPEIDYMGWKPVFDELHEAVVGVELAYVLIEGGYNYYSLFFSAFERVQYIANRILTEAPEAVRNIFIHSDLYSLDSLDDLLGEGTEDDDTEEGSYWSYDYVIGVYRAIYANALLSLYGGQSVYDYYVESNMADFLNKSYDVIWALMWTEDEAADNYDKALVLQAINAFYKLDMTAQTMFLIYMDAGGDSSNGFYYMALEEFLNEDFTNNAADVAGKLFGIEMDYIVYMNLKSKDSLDDMKTHLAELKDAYEALEGDDKASFADFEEMYNHYVSVCEAAIAEAESNTENAA